MQLLLDKAVERKESFEPITMEAAIATMEPVKNRNENRPV